ncbi:MAG: NADPH:quinone reductase, partial [Rhodanobacteraceae bacterium]
MKAIRVKQFGEPEVLQLDTVPDPKPGKGQVVVRVHAAGVNPVETYVRSGKYAALPELPCTPGTDAAGVIEAVGPGVEGFRVGDRVYTAGTVSGSYAELALADAANVHRLPERTSFAQGAALGVPYATAYRALFQRAHARAGETLLVHGGTGGVGLAAIQLAVSAGLRVIATGGSDAGRKLAAEQGAEHVLDHHRDGYLQEVASLTGGQGVDVILEMLANVNLGHNLGVLAHA